MIVKRLAVAAFAIAVSIGAAGAPPAAGAAAPGPDTRPAGLKPAAVEQVAPWTGTATGNEQPSTGETDNAVTEGDQAAYLREKAAAVRGPAPMDAEKVTLSGAQSGRSQIAAAVPVAFTVLDQPTTGGVLRHARRQRPVLRDRHAARRPRRHGPGQ
jgi:hypothetical protein